MLGIKKTLSSPQQNTSAKAVLLILAAIFLILFSAIFLLGGYDYSSVIMVDNVSEVSGILDEVYVSEDGDVSLYLEGNDEEYYIATELFDIVEANNNNKLRIGNKISMTVGKSVMDTVYVIKLTNEGVTYLSLETGYEHYYVESIILYVVGAVCAVAAVIFIIIYKKKTKNKKGANRTTDLLKEIAEEGDTVLWHKTLTAKDMIATMFKPFVIIMLIYTAMGLLLCLSAEVNIVYIIIFLCIVAILSFAILCITAAIPRNKHIYVVTDKRIVVSIPAMLLFLNFEDIKEIRIKNSLFFKDKKALHFIPTYKASVKYRFIMLENAEEIKKLILTKAKNESEF
ncbi:MAG: hypothetical protein IKU48_02030 [Clostridia bacterium]|nr:hypothetical protein [Clostridia bacterium]